MVGGFLCAQSLQEGSSLRCSRCQLTYYKDRDAQKKHWKLHKKHCALLSDDQKSQIDGMSFDSATSHLMHTILGDHRAGESCCCSDTVYLLRHIRKLFDDKAEGAGDAEMELHTLARSTLVMTPKDSMIASFYAQPGMVNYLLLSDGDSSVSDDLLNNKTRIIKNQLAKYNGEPTPEFCQYFIKDQVERKRVLAVKKQIEDADEFSFFSSPASMQFCYVYFNCIVAGAIQAGRSMSSIHDGKGRWRLIGDGTLNLKCLERAMQLWADPWVRASCGDAMAPAASLCCTAMTIFDHPEGYQLVPGLDIDQAVLTCLSEMGECAGSADYSRKIIHAIANMAPETAYFCWAAMPLENRARVARATAAYLFSHGVKDVQAGEADGGGSSGGCHVPATDLKNILFMACETEDEQDNNVRRDVWQMCADDEYLGPDACGHNSDCRAYFHYLLRLTADDPDRMLTAAETMDIWQGIPWPKKGAKSSAKSLEKKACLALTKSPEEFEDLCMIMGS